MRTSSDEYAITVELRIPSADEECPITQEPMLTYDLEFLQHVAFIPELPLFRKLTLPCGHSFSAMAITYHFLKNSMQCPLCRTGSKLPLAPLYIPEHFRADMQAKVAVERAQSRIAEERDNLMETLSLLRDEVGRSHDDQSGLTHFLATFLSGQAVVLSVYAYDDSDDIRPLLVTEYPMEITIPTFQQELEVRLPRAFVRQLGANLRHVHGIGKFCFVVGTRSPVGGVVELDRSALFSVAALDTRGPRGGLVIPTATAHPSHFELWTLPDSHSIEAVQWFTHPMRFLDAVFGRTGLARQIVIVHSGDPSLIISLDDMED